MKVAGMLIIGLLLVFLIIPVYSAMVIVLTNRTLDGEPPAIGKALREALRRYGRVLGNNVLYWLISFGIYMAVSMANAFMSIIYGGVMLSSAALSGSEAVAAAGSVTFLILYLLFAYGGTFVYYYFLIRFGYFLPPVLFEGEGVGIARSWSLTRRSFWRLLAVYIIFSALSYVFAIALGVVLAAFGVSVAGLLLALVVFCALIPAFSVVYTFTYRVQKVRTDADDVEALLLRLRGTQSGAPAVQAGGVDS